MPSSCALRIAAVAACSSKEPHSPPSSHVPKQIGDTFKPLRPSVTLSIGPPVLFPASRCRVPFQGSVRLCRLEGLRHDRQVLVAESLVDDLLPFVGQTSERGEVSVVGHLECEAHVLERERQGKL